MEAVAQWDFDAERGDEMSIKKGDTVSVTSTEDKDWYMAVMGNQSGFIPGKYVKLEYPDWYKDSFTRAEAEQYLLKVDSMRSYVYPDGFFLVRRGEQFALSVKHESTVQHFRILTDSNKFYVWPNSVFTSINQLVMHYHKESISGHQNKVIKLCSVEQELLEALYNFLPANDEEVELRQGDIICLISRSDPNWWEGEVNGKIGYFPSNYVKKYGK